MSEENGTSQYIVQVKGDMGGWDDVATVPVPHRTKRRTIIEKALADAGYNAAEWDRGALTVRVLDEASARETPVSPKVGPASWEIG